MAKLTFTVANPDDRPKPKSKGSKDESNLIFSAIFSFLFLYFCEWMWPWCTPWTVFGLWSMGEGGIIGGVLASWPIFLWCTVITSIISIFTLNNHKINQNAEHIIIGGTVISAVAGIFEEIIFRWIVFQSGIIGIRIFDWLFGGFIFDHGLLWFLHCYLFGPVVNFLTFGKMEWLIYGMGWYVGAAALAANAKFRKEHAYLGWFGLINSWIIGFFLFWIMFNYGLITAIIVHFLYDLFIYLVRYIDAAIERALGIGKHDFV